MGLGVDLSSVRRQVVSLLDAGPGPHAPEEGRAHEAAVPLACNGCGADLAESARYRVLEVPPDETAAAQPPVHAALLYCSRCGVLLLPAANPCMVLGGQLTETVAGFGQGDPAAEEDKAGLAQAVEAGQAARAEMASGEPLSVARRRELRRAAREGDAAAEALRRRQPPDDQQG